MKKQKKITKDGGWEPLFKTREYTTNHHYMKYREQMTIVRILSSRAASARYDGSSEYYLL